MTRVKKKGRSRILWITDPWDTLDHVRDTTLRLAQEALELGIDQAWCDVKSFRLENNQLFFSTRTLKEMGPSREIQSIVRSEPVTESLEAFTSAQYRVDPPVDGAYLYPLQMLAMSSLRAKRCELVNPFEVLFQLNEKMEGTLLPELSPPSLVSCQWEHLAQFGQKQGKTVLKPLNDAASHGIELLDWRTADSMEHAKTRLNQATRQFQVPVILQRYLAGIADGETRLWYLDGKLLAYAKKLPITGDFRVDIDRGSQLASTRLTASEKKKATQIAKHLKARKIRLAAVDLIEGWITDFNFTSPGLIVQMERVLDENLARPIVQALVSRS